jgi:hypothetical protein
MQQDVLVPTIVRHDFVLKAHDHKRYSEMTLDQIHKKIRRGKFWSGLIATSWFLVLLAPEARSVAAFIGAAAVALYVIRYGDNQADKTMEGWRYATRPEVGEAATQD